MAADPLKLLPLPTPNPTQPATVSPNPITTVTSLPHSLALPPLGPSDPWADEGRSPSPSPTHQWMDGDGAMMARWRRPPWRTRAGSRPSPPSPTCWRLCSRVGPRRRRKESTAAACTSDDPVYEFITSDTVYSPQVSCWRPGPVRSARIEGGRALITFVGDRTVVQMYKFLKKHAAVPFNSDAAAAGCASASAGCASASATNCLGARELAQS
ncbi:hypothetical protein CFC21_086842 [Triticum aestivum]|uniref:Uncharacterized protein n=2 Tax=Triticum aestivum TaxID=4565 RepID=A0A9R1L9X0_WHEAT|nr:uncharacterized protein LOC119323031 [Triticum dicoccoides]XP_044411176.1 uncharacterized protein LOC123135967 [Triticum aestivum]KAF7083020.1 hypothetical protein CFC21_086842 [Triticum aestivum]